VLMDPEAPAGPGHSHKSNTVLFVPHVMFQILAQTAHDLENMSSRQHCKGYCALHVQLASHSILPPCQPAALNMIGLSRRRLRGSPGVMLKLRPLYE
jgi:hypothetical protein